MTGTILLDSAALSKLYRGDRAVNVLIAAAERDGLTVGTTVLARLAAEHGTARTAKVEWILSRLRLHAVTHAVSDAAAELLRLHRLAGNEHANDATLAAVARSAGSPVTVATSGPGKLPLLCGPEIAVLRV